MSLLYVYIYIQEGIDSSQTPTLCSLADQFYFVCKKTVDMVPRVGGHQLHSLLGCQVIEFREPVPVMKP